MQLTKPSFGPEELSAVGRVLDSGWVTQGPITKRFEELFRVRHEVGYALATTSCTAALHCATMALGFGPGDEVVVPALTWITSANCVEYVGAKVVFADVDPNTFNIAPENLRSAISPRTKAIVVVHLFGLAAEMDQILALAHRHSLFIIEDAACAVGTTYGGRPVGGLGEVGCFSFHPRKVITTGEGGMVTTNDANLAARVEALKCHGASGPPDTGDGAPKPYSMGRFDMLGFNLRLSDIQAAVGVAQMSRLDALLVERRLRAERYTQLLADFADIGLPVAPSRCGHTYQSYVIRVLDGGVRRRNLIMEYLDAAGIQTRPGTHAVHRLGYYKNKYNLRAEDFPNACLGEDTTITLPIFPGMTDEDQEVVAAVLNSALQRLA